MKRFLTFLLKRFLAIPITLFFITLVLYGMVMIMPFESRVSLYLPTTRLMNEEHMARIRLQTIERYHLEDPFPLQYASWVRSLFESNWGYSPSLERAVLPELINRLPVTLELLIGTMLIQIPFGLIAGVAAAQRKEKLADHGFRLIAFIASAFPDFILAIMLLSVFYLSLHWFPPERLSTTYHLLVQGKEFTNYTGFILLDSILNQRFDVMLDAIRHLVLPVLVLGLSHWATLARLTRAEVIEEMQKDYITAAYARGLNKKKAVWRHAFRNALAPTLNSSALSAAALVTSVFVVERMFNFKGVSVLLFSRNSIVPDAPAIMGFALYAVILVLLIMFILDVLQAFLLPETGAEMLYDD